MPKKITWASQQKKSIAALRLFTKFLSTHDQLIYASDIHRGLLHTYMTSTNGIDTNRCILQEIVNHDTPSEYNKYDAKLNIEIQPFDSDATYVFIAFHQRRKKLANFESWEWDNA